MTTARELETRKINTIYLKQMGIQKGFFNIFFSIAQTKQRFRDCQRAHENTQGLKWPLLAQAGAIMPCCLGLFPQTPSFSLGKRHHVYKVKLKQENIKPGQCKTNPGKRLGLTSLEPSRVRFLKKGINKDGLSVSASERCCSYL